MDFDLEALTALGISLASLLNIGYMLYQAKKKLPSEVSKQKAEAVESYSEGAESVLSASKISNDLLMQRIVELKKDRRDKDNYIAVLKKALIEGKLPVPEFIPLDSDPKINGKVSG